ncbi:hypothetical protein [Kocuria tytonis]|uniref:Uncharacterized protein n=1 Tax=Kocuria tytonis TaxID=2054280 RepID=A0A495A474_9MICC|nr:hypothetical protein [Kocuria tytonis]RKQ34182.1 hypothetical protein C1C97_010115 [Kocuria tytonis]
MSLGQAENPAGSQSSLLCAVMGLDISPRPHYPWWVPYRRLALLRDVLAVGTAMVVATHAPAPWRRVCHGDGVVWFSPPSFATLIGAG